MAYVQREDGQRGQKTQTDRENIQSGQKALKLTGLCRRRTHFGLTRSRIDQDVSDFDGFGGWFLATPRRGTTCTPERALGNAALCSQVISGSGVRACCGALHTRRAPRQEAPAVGRRPAWGRARRGGAGRRRARGPSVGAGARVQGPPGEAAAPRVACARAPLSAGPSGFSPRSSTL